MLWRNSEYNSNNNTVKYNTYIYFIHKTLLEYITKFGFLKIKYYILKKKQTFIFIQRLDYFKGNYYLKQSNSM